MPAAVQTQGWSLMLYVHQLITNMIALAFPFMSVAALSVRASYMCKAVMVVYIAPCCSAQIHTMIEIAAFM